MAKRGLKWDDNKKQEFINDGRGQGIGKEYKPWQKIQDFPSMGRSSRVFGWKTKRIHHFFTDIQTKYFYLLEWDDSVLDIREHFPLLDVEDVIKYRKDLDFALFTDRDSQVTYVLSTTFLITLNDGNGGLKYAARSIKSSTEIEKKKSLEKLEIERRYWEEKNIDWGIVTQKDIPNSLTKNIEWIHSSLYDYETRNLTAEEVEFMSIALVDKILRSSKVIRDSIAEFDKEFNYEIGTGLYIFKYLIASKKLKIDMNKEIDINKLFSSGIDIKSCIKEESSIDIS